MNRVQAVDRVHYADRYELLASESDWLLGVAEIVRV